MRGAAVIAPTYQSRARVRSLSASAACEPRNARRSRELRWPDPKRRTQVAASCRRRRASRPAARQSRGGAVFVAADQPAHCAAATFARRARRVGVSTAPGGGVLSATCERSWRTRAHAHTPTPLTGILLGPCCHDGLSARLIEQSGACGCRISCAGPRARHARAAAELCTHTYTPTHTHTPTHAQTHTHVCRRL